MRFSLILSDNIDSKDISFIKDKVYCISGLISFDVYDKKIDIVFAKGQDDIESVIEIINLKGYDIIFDDEISFPNISKSELMISLILLFISFLFSYEILNTFICFVMVFCVANKIVNFAFLKIKNRQLTFAFISTLFCVFAFLSGLVEFILPRLNLDFSFIGSLVMALCINYYFVLNLFKRK